MDNPIQSKPTETKQQKLSENQAPQLSKKLHWQSFFIGIIVVIFIEIIASHLLKSENKQNINTLPPTSAPTSSQVANDSTANWKTFDDKTLHVSFAYPPDWQKASYGSGFNGIRPIKDYNSESIRTTGFPTSIVVKAFNGNINTFIPDPRASNSVRSKSSAAITSKDISNSFYKITQYAIKTNFPGSPYDGTIYQVTVVEKGNEKVAFMDFSGSKTLLLQILNTFNFTDSPPISCRPRPACLDATPRCAIPETGDMCPPSTPTPPLSK